MKIKPKIWLLFITLALLAFVFYKGLSANVQMLNPAGEIAQQQRSLLALCVGLMLIVAVVVFLLYALVVKKYQDKNGAINQSGESKPWLQWLIWLVPIVVIGIISILNWKSAHQLDPYKALKFGQKPLVVQVVALNWKWLFIYPEQNVATINYLELPVNVPVKFELTADAPMNTFWIPQLGSQMYAMAGMQNTLNLAADKVGEYNGSATEINGAGYSGMRFKTKVVLQDDFDRWVIAAKASNIFLGMEEYQRLVKNSENNAVKIYAAVEPGIFMSIIQKYMPMEKAMEGMH